MNESKRAQRIAKEYDIEFSVALDIDLLRCYEKRIVQAAKKNKQLRDFEVMNVDLEKQLTKLGV